MNEKELNIALGKLFNGIELDTHKIELGLVNDVKKLSNNIEQDWKKALNIAVNGAKSLEDKVMKATKPLNDQVFELRQSIDKAEQALKELGIGKNSDIEKAKKQLKIAAGQSKELNAVATRIRNIY
tara:strand:+ start:2607 stop:2984 length:378 start_codon:yes stop_codon:yes gene_type:complete